MEVVANNYLPGDQHLVEQIVYELKSQGIFDQFRKECFADVDTKPAYQNLRQRVEGSVSSFLKDQRWKPDMNKNQAREMLRKKITESGFLETGVERIVDQVVNPKINTVFLPKVEEVVYSYLGVQKPSRSEMQKTDDQIDLLPTDLEAVSPESEGLDKTADKSSDSVPDLDGSNKTEDESPAFEPLEEQSYVPQEENSVDSHLSGFSGLVSHESDQSLENKVIPMEQDSQMSHNSSESRLSVVTSDETSKVDTCEDSSKSVKSESNNKVEKKAVDDNKTTEKNDKSKYKSSDRHKSRSETKSDKDKSSKGGKDLKPKYSSSSSASSKDKDKSRDKRDSRDLSSSKSNKLDKSKEKTDKDRSKSSKSSSSSSNGSSSKDKQEKRDVSKSDRDKDKGKEKVNDKDKEKDRDRSRSSHSKSRDKSSDSKSKEKSSSSTDKHKHSSSHSDRHKKEKDKKKDDKNKSKDDHYSLKEKRSGRRSTDRDSNDGHSGKPHYYNSSEENNTSAQAQQTAQDPIQSTGNSGNLDQVESTKAAIDISDEVGDAEISLKPTKPMKLFKPKCASNIHEAMRLIKIRKQLAKLEKHNQLSFATVDVSSSILLKSSIDLDKIKPNGLANARVRRERNSKNKTKNERDAERKKNEDLSDINEEKKSEDHLPIANTVISQDSWDAMEAKLRAEVSSEFKALHEEEINGSEQLEYESCKYFEKVDISKNDFINFVTAYIEKVDKCTKLQANENLVKKPTTNIGSNAGLQKITDTRKTKKLKIDDTNLNIDLDFSDNRNQRKRKIEIADLKNNADNEKVTDVKNNNNNKKAKMVSKKINKKNNNIIDISNEKFSLPLSPAESDKSMEPKIESATPSANLKRSNLLKNQRYSSDDLYKPRPSFGTSRRRGAKITEN